ncbi:hypothetical protein BGZ70_005815 [Mortierella alpina]|uniref:Uncharacterized protein n=1 Tax=Mortierella alpina TaxID=64518 RepID=A0A9P6M3E5_MORAP|nr:hypothetical protein BGZ70_005815 [Mortierella alpina]
MFLTQTVSAVVFTAARLGLELGIIGVVTALVARTYNLTYLERLRGGPVSKIEFVFLTRFRKDKHVFVRVCLVFVIIASTLLTWLPTLLSRLYPVKPVYVASSNVAHDIPMDSLKLVKVDPGNATAPAILAKMGVDVGESILHSYSVDRPSTAPCGYAGGDKDLNSLACFGDLMMFAGSPGLSKDQAIVTILGYIAHEDYGAMIVERKFKYQHSSAKVLNCLIIQDRSLQKKCQLLFSMIRSGSVHYDETMTIGIQSTVSIPGGLLWELVWIKHAAAPVGPQTFEIVETIRFNITIKGFSGALGHEHIGIERECKLGQELVETAKVYTDGGDADFEEWDNWGFSPDEVEQITDFILQGTPLFGGSTLLTPSRLLADVSDIMIGILFGMAALLFFCGFILTCGLDPIVTQPLSNLFQQALVSPGVSEEESRNRALENRMADIRLQRRSLGGNSTPVVLVNDHVLGLDSDFESKAASDLPSESTLRSSRGLGYHENVSSTPLLSAAATLCDNIHVL